MKKIILLLSLLSVFQPAFAQDSTKITYSVETDTLVKQRFIDRYENVFMTKVPTRHMFKIGIEFYPLGHFEYGSSNLHTKSLTLGYEYKLMPSISLGINLKSNGSWSQSSVFSGSLAANIQGRWYFDMNRRIREGKSANNFSGNYLAIVGEKYWQSYYNVYPQIRTGLEFGLQRRFFNNGAIDFAAGVYYQRYRDGNLISEFSNLIRKEKDFEISTRTTLGLAFGDWKRAGHIPACDILRCDEAVYSQWKILWPIVRISSNIINGSIGVAYERKLGNTPVSINTQLLADYNHINSNFILNSRVYNPRQYQIQSSIQARYYFLQKQNIRKGRGGNNLSGFYAGPNVDYVYYYNSEMYDRNKLHLGAGINYGYQKTLFRNAYIDISGTQSWNLLTNQSGKNRLGSFRIGFGLSF